MLETGSGATSGDSCVRSKLRAIRSSATPPHNEMDAQTHLASHQGQGHSIGQQSPKPATRVAGPSIPKVSGSNAHSDSEHGNHDGLLKNRMVRGAPPKQGLGLLAQESQPDSYKLVGTKSHSPDVVTLSSKNHGSCSPSVVRQHDSISLPEKTRNPTNRLSDVAHNRDSGSLRFDRGSSSPSSPSRGAECASGSGVQSRSDRFRMGLRQNDLPMGSTSSSSVSPNRPVCHKGQQPNKEVHLSMPGPSGGGHGRKHGRLESLEVRIPFSAVKIPPVSHRQNLSFQGEGSPHRPPPSRFAHVGVAQLAVPGPAQIATPRILEPAHDTRGGVSPSSGIIEASRVDSISKAYKRKGFSQRSINYFNKGLTESSKKTYQSAWGLFLEFLATQGVPFHSASEAHVFDFLAHQIDHLNRKYRTIAKYRSALRIPLKVTLNVDIDSVFSHYFMRGYYRANPPSRVPMPTWSLDTLLDFLKSDIFEPLDQVDFFHLTLKTLVLIILATGRRISEVANISRESFHCGNSTVLFLQWVSEFQPKNFVLVEKGKAKNKVAIPSCPSISPLAVKGKEDRSLCPVRAFRIFRDRTSGTGFSKVFLWDHLSNKEKVNVSKLTRTFIQAVEFSQTHAGIFGNPAIGPHQGRKLAASYGLLLCNNLRDERALMHAMGFSSLSVLRKVYINNVPPLSHKCVVPGGTYIPGVSRDTPYR